MLKTLPLLIGAIALSLPIMVASTAPAEAACRQLAGTPCPGTPTDDDDPNDNGNPGGTSGHGDRRPENIMIVSCLVQGVPEIDPDDLTFKNVGEITIPAGTEISWQVKQVNERGRYYLPRDLRVGAEIDYDDILKTGAPAKTRCLSSIIN